MFYVVGTDPSRGPGWNPAPAVEVLPQKRRGWSKMTPLKLGDNAWPVQVTPLDKELFGLLRGFKPAANSFFSIFLLCQSKPGQFPVSAFGCGRQTGTSLGLLHGPVPIRQSNHPGRRPYPLTWDGEKPWNLRLHLAPPGGRGVSPHGPSPPGEGTACLGPKRRS